MLLFPPRSGFKIVADLKRSQTSDLGSPRQLSNDNPLTLKRIIFDLVIACPIVLSRVCEDRLFVGDISVLERELPHAKCRQSVDIPLDVAWRLNVPARHDARRADGNRSCCCKKIGQRRRASSHQLSASFVVIVMP